MATARQICNMWDHILNFRINSFIIKIHDIRQNAQLIISQVFNCAETITNYQNLLINCNFYVN